MKKDEELANQFAKDNDDQWDKGNYSGALKEGFLAGRKSNKPFNQLSTRQAELLALLVEECGEVIQSATKILRHGYESVNPDERSGPNNRQHLEREIGDMMAAVDLLDANKDIDEDAVEMCRHHKLARVGKWLHHWNEKVEL